MNEKVKDVLTTKELKQEVHQAFSAGCFNDCWSYIDKTDRTSEDVDMMLFAAHASMWHWRHRSDCKPVNVSVGYWQLARCYALAGDGEMARRFGESSERVSVESELAPFYTGYAREALARAALVSGDRETAESHLAKAKADLALVEDKDERGFLEADLTSLSLQLK